MMRDEKNKKQKIIFGTLMIAFILVGAAVGFYNVVTVDNETIKETIVYPQREWAIFTGDSDPGAGNCGIMLMGTKSYEADPGTAYASNISTGDCYEYAETYTDTEMTGETPHSTAYDKFVKFRVNDTWGYDTVNATWRTDWVTATMNVDFEYVADISGISMTVYMIANNTDYAWFNGVLQDADGGAGTGFTISAGEDITSMQVTWSVFKLP